MSKVRIYELAKELNTTSKRLIEKLEEIGIHVKNHMSILEEDELSALYDHIGVTKRIKKENEETEEKKAVPSPSKIEKVEKREAKSIKSAPRIIRTTEIIIDTKNDIKEIKTISNNQIRTDRINLKAEKNDEPERQDYRKGIRRTDTVQDLRPGFVRSTDIETLISSEAKARKKAEKAASPVSQAGSIQNSQDASVQAKSETKVSGKENPVSPVILEEASKKVSAADKSASARKVEPKEATVGANAAGMAQSTTAGSVVSAEVKNISTAKAGTEQTPGSRPVEKAISEGTTVQPGGERTSMDNKEDRSVSQEKNMGRSVTEVEKAAQKDEAKSHAAQQMGGTGKGEVAGAERRDNNIQSDSQDKRAGAGEGNIRGQNDRKDAGHQASGHTGQGGHRSERKEGQQNRNDRQDLPKAGQKAGQGHGHESAKSAGQGGNVNRTGGQQGGGKAVQQSMGKPGQPGGKSAGQQQGGGFGGGDRQGYKSQRMLDIPKVPDLEEFKREEKSREDKSASKRSYSDRDDLDLKEGRKEQKPAAKLGRGEKFRAPKVIGGQRISDVLDDDHLLDEIYEGSQKRLKKPSKNKRKAEENKYVPPKEVLTEVTLPETMTVKELAEAIKKTATEVIKKLMDLGILATINQELDFDTAAYIANEFGINAKKEVVVSEEDILFDDEEDDPADLVPRPPVVVVMGHVDHGKTSLLDAIRKTNVTEKEAGGITQHIGAYMVKINDRYITFLDTPGHEAFTAMRARGAQVTDIAILVVAADDGVMPQTIEAINHAKAANVSIVVAVNKIDKPTANPDRVKQQLAEHGVVVEEWGGDTICVPVSAKTGKGIDELLEMVLLTADMLELKANPKKQAKGTIIEAKLDKSKGPTATALVQRGVLKVGDTIVTGTVVGHIRAMTNDRGISIKEAGPSTPVEILGLPEVPEAGEVFYAIKDEKVAKSLVEKRKNKLRDEQLNATSRVTLDDLFNQIQEGKVKELNLIVKADVQGSVEAVKQSLEKLSNDEVKVRIIHGGVGAITESDVSLAYVSNAIVIGFNVRPAPKVTEIAKDSNVEIKLYRVIYEAIDDIANAMKGMLEPKFREVVLGHAEIRQIFKVSGVGTVGGCYVTDGKIARNADVRLVRDGIVVYEGKLASLKRFKDDVREVVQGFECGIGLDRFNDIKEGDVIEAFAMEEVKR